MTLVDQIVATPDVAIKPGTHLIRVGYYPKWRDHQRDPYLNIDPDQIVRQARDMGATVLEWAVPENHVFIEWDGVLPHPAQSLYDGDLLADVSRACRQYGVKLLLCWATNAIHEDMADWLRRDWATIQTTGFDLGKIGTYHRHICPNYQRHRQWVAGYVCELAQRYDIDGFIFDGPWFQHHHVWPRNADGSVACRICCDAYKQATGRDVPLKLDWSSRDCLDYIDYFKSEVYRGYIRWLTGVVRRKHPHLYISYNSPIYIWGGWGDSCTPDAADLADSFYVEMHLAGREELQPVLQLKLNRAALGGKPPEMYCKTFDLAVANFAYSRPPLCEVRALGYITLSEAAIIGIHSSMDENGRAHPERSSVFAEFGAELSPKMPYYVDAAPVEFAGIHFSERTRDLYAGENPSQYLVSPVGMAQLFAESQKTYGFVLDDNLEDLSRLGRHKMIVLANSACLSMEQAQAVREYVSGGGCLLATGETSLFDENDSLQRDFLLADVLGVRFNGPSSERLKHRGSPLHDRYPFLLKSHEISEGLQDRMISRRPWFEIEANADREILATWAQVREETDFGCVNGGLEIIGDSQLPAIVAGRFGKGKVVYCACDISGQYMFEMNRHIRMLVRQAARWLSRDAVEVAAPKHVHFAITAQTGQSRVVLHFVNVLFNNKSANEVLGHGFPYDPAAYRKREGTADPCCSQPGRTDGLAAECIRQYRAKHVRKESYCPTGADQLSAYDEVIPLHGIKVSIDPRAYAFSRAFDIDTGKTLACGVTDDGRREIVLDELQVYRGIVLQM